MPKILGKKLDPKLAINLVDLERMPTLIRDMLKLAERLEKEPSALVKIDKARPDEIGVLFTCDLLTAATVCDIIRNKDREVGDYPTRVYLKRVTAWEKLNSSATLTVVRKVKEEENDGEPGMVVLNPKIFPSSNSKISSATPTPPKFAKIEIQGGGFLDY